MVALFPGLILVTCLVVFLSIVVLVYLLLALCLCLRRLCLLLTLQIAMYVEIFNHTVFNKVMVNRALPNNYFGYSYWIIASDKFSVALSKFPLSSDFWLLLFRLKDIPGCLSQDMNLNVHCALSGIQYSEGKKMEYDKLIIFRDFSFSNHEIVWLVFVLVVEYSMSIFSGIFL